MARVYLINSQASIHWPVVLLIVYGILALMAAVFLLFLAYRGDKAYKHVPEQIRNRRWMKPLLPIIFVILPALLWPIVMVSVGAFVIGAFLFNKKDGVLKIMRGGKKEKDAEMGLELNETPIEQSTPEHNLAATTNSANATIISEPPPAYTPHDGSRRLLLEGQIPR